MDADGRRRILCLSTFGNKNIDLKTGIAKNRFHRSISCIPTHPFQRKSKSTTSRAWGKFIGKVIGSALKKEVISSLQICAEQEAVSEAATHAVDKIFEVESTESIFSS